MTPQSDSLYILFIVKLPLPVQPEPPVSDHVPAIVLPATVPERVNVLPAEEDDCTFSPNFPLTLPLKSPANVNVPVSVSPETKHGELVEKLKLLTFTLPLPLSARDVVNANACVPPVSINVAVQLPLILVVLLLLVPQPMKREPNSKTIPAV